MTTTMNAKLNVLDQVMDTVVAPRAESAAVWPDSRTTKPTVRLRRTSARIAAPAPAESLWRVTMAEARDGVVERALTWTLMAAGLAGLGWLAYAGLQFLLAWEGLVSWVRAAMV